MTGCSSAGLAGEIHAERRPQNARLRAGSDRGAPASKGRPALQAERSDAGRLAWRGPPAMIGRPAGEECTVLENRSRRADAETDSEPVAPARHHRPLRPVASPP